MSPAPADLRYNSDMASVWSRLPNLITGVRIGLVPVFLVCAAACQATAGGDREAAWRAAALAALLVLGASDVVDGWMARRFGWTSQLGAVLDAVADKLAQVASLAFFTVSAGDAFDTLPIWFLGLVAGRDLLLAAGYVIVRRRRGRVYVVHELHGKLASVLIFLLVVALTAGAPLRWLLPGLLVTSALIVLSTWIYVRAGLAQHAGRDA